jgi:predicted ribosomally synthesized peptide with SipW-like signal peptide
MKRFNRKRRVVLAALLALIVAVTAGAFTATNTFSGPNRAGDGTGVISGYTVSNIHYTIDNADPSRMTAVQFDLDTTAADVRARVDNNAWTTCTNTAANTWSCTFGAPLSINPAANLEVVAVS